MIELALVTPILLVLLAGAVDFGRAFYSYVAIENAAKEGALFGSNSPLCDDNAEIGCADPHNVIWHVQSELKNQNLRNPDGSPLVPTIACLAPNGTPRATMDACAQGDTYEVSLSYPFRLVTPILGSVIGDKLLSTTARAVVFNLAFDPTPGASIQKLVLPGMATNAADVIADCLEPDDHDSAGYYRSPCLNSTTPDPNDRLTLHFEEGATISYKLTVGNSGAQPLTSVSVADSTGSTGCSFPTTLAVGASANPCFYTRTAPVVTSGVTTNYDNVVTVDSAQTNPETDRVTVAVDKPPARLRVLKWVSPFKEGDDGDGNPSFGTLSSVAVTYNAQIPTPFVWFKVIVINTGGQTATGVQVTDSRGPLPFGQSNATADCDATPTTLAKNAVWECRYRVTLSSASPASTDNLASATATNVITDGDDQSTATVQVSQCTGATNRVIPNLIGQPSSSAAQTAWTQAGFTGALTDDDGHDNKTVQHQGRKAYLCMPAGTGMTFGNDQTP